MRQIFRSNTAVFFYRIALIYLLLLICRVVFYIYNQDIIGQIHTSELPSLLRGALLFDSISLVYSNGLFVVASLIPFTFRYKTSYQRVLYWYFIVVNTIVLGLNMIDAVYFHYTQIRLTAADFIFANNDNTLLLIGRFLMENWFLVVIWIVMIALMIFAYIRIGYPEKLSLRRRYFYALNIAIFIAAAVGCVALARGGGLSRTIRPVTLGNATNYTSSPSKAGMILSNPFCILRTVGSESLNIVKYYDTAELNDIYTPYHYPSEGDFEYNLSDRNIVLFVMESFSAEHSAYLNPDLYPYPDQGFTPFLDSLMRDGYTFHRAYSNGRKSVEALPAILGSIPSFKKPFALMPQSLGQSRQLPAILNGMGYQTMFFCGSPSGSMGFEAYANMSGIRTMHSKDDYDRARPGNRDFDGFWGVWDMPFFDFMGETLGEVEQPFFATIFSLTSHHPFKVPAAYENSLPDGITKIHKPVAYTDTALREFFSQHGSEDWFSNTIFVFVADHVSSERFAPESETTLGRHHIVLFMYTPDGTLKGDDFSVSQQVDIMPTLLGLVNSEEPYFAFGRDVFNEKERMAVAFNYYNNFQIISDSINLMFDEHNIVSAFSTNDTLQENNIADDSDPVQTQLKSYLQAVIQQYYTHVENRTYLVEQVDRGES